MNEEQMQQTQPSDAADDYELMEEIEVAPSDGPTPGKAGSAVNSIVNDPVNPYGPQFLVIAYMVIWVFIFGYVFYLGRRQKALSAEIAQLKTALEENEKRSGS